MNKHIKRYQKIISNLINKSFPKLKGRKVRIFETKLFVTHGMYLPVFNFIIIHKKCRHFSNNVIKGVIVHELCHAEQSIKVGFLKDILYDIIYWFSPKFKKKIEIDADKRAIKKGYSKELYESTKKFETEFGKIEYGLSLKQIKDYAKKIRK